MIDLRPLRPLLTGKKLVAEETVRRVIFGYDAVLVVAVLHRASLFV